MENAAKTVPGWPGWPSEEELALYGEVGLTSLPYGTELDERYPPELPEEGAPALAALPEQEPLELAASWDFAEGRFREPAARDLLSKFCDLDGIDVETRSRPDARAQALGEERRLAFQPAVPLWVLAFRESVSRSRAWGPAQALRSQLAGAFYRSFLRAWFAEPEKDWPESSDIFLDSLYKSCESHGNGRSRDLGDRPELLPANYCGGAVSIALVDGLRSAGWKLVLPDEWSDYAHRKDWNLAVTEYAGSRAPREPFVHDKNPEPIPRAGDIVTLVLHGAISPPTGHFAMILAARMPLPDSGWLYVASGSTGPMRTVAVDLVKIVPRDPAFHYPYPEGSPRPAAGCAWITELNRTSLLLPTRRLGSYSRDGLLQLKVERASP
jgi:hypothetical protein